MSHLRNLALTVDEGDPGQFTWIIIESEGDAVVYDETHSHGQGHYPTYVQALNAGVKANPERDTYRCLKAGAPNVSLQAHERKQWRAGCPWMSTDGAPPTS